MKKHLILFSFIFIPMFATGSESNLKKQKCSDYINPDSAKFKSLAERIFSAYTEGEFKEYKVFEPLVCGKVIHAIVQATGKDTAFGRYWEISFDLQDQIMTVRPGM